MNPTHYPAIALTALVSCFGVSSVLAQETPAPAKPRLKDELRLPWTRNDESGLRRWLVAGPILGDLATDELAAQGGEAAVLPKDGDEVKPAQGAAVKWHPVTSWSDAVGLEDLEGPKEGVVAYAFAKVTRAAAGKALLSMGSDEGIRVWLNGKLVLSRDGLRSLVPDEDQVEVEMKAGENALLVKVPQQMGRWAFCARVLEPGTVLRRKAEIGPSIVEVKPDGFTLRTDVSGARVDADPVQVDVVAPGGRVVYTTSAPRGARLAIDAREWTDGPYEARCSTRTFDGRLFATHLAWYKGDALAKARELAAAAAKADASQPEGFTLRMLAEMVDDRLGVALAKAAGNPWWRIHSPLMEYDELMLERGGTTGRVRPHGFVRLAWRDEVDGSPQYCRAYLPASYEPARKWPLVVQIHGYNPANPVYVRWWSADQRHADVDTEFANGEQVIYVEPHGRGNTQYRGMGDSDVVRAIAEAKRLFSVDEDRVYLTGDSMGGWGTWNVATRHPDLFAAIAPVFGGVDYHSLLSEEELGRLDPLERLMQEKQSSWAMAEGLLNTPILVQHGDADQAVNVEYSRWAMRLLQRWGYDVRYHEYPGRIHEALESRNNGNLSIEWLLKHRRDPNPRRVRIRSAELRHARAFWAGVLRAASPRAFMLLDAEVVDRNVIRLDTENALEVVLSPAAALVDPSKPVQVVWNGAARSVAWQQGKLLLSATSSPAGLLKSPALPGTLADFAATPFAIVVGTTSKDRQLAALCRQKADGIVDAWRSWQRQTPRVFDDTKITDAELARYSLLLIGGPEANRVTAKLAARLPLQIAVDHVAIDGHAFAARDAAVQLLYPSPLNPERYVFVAAATSAEGMSFLSPGLPGSPDWDYLVVDGHVAAPGQGASVLQTRVVSGLFDSSWRFSDELARPGDPSLRAKGHLLRGPRPELVVAPQTLDSYVGRYQIERGPLVEVVKNGTRLVAKLPGQPDAPLVPCSDTEFVLPAAGVWVSFTREASGRVGGFDAYQPGDDGGGSFTGRRLD